MKWCTTIKKMLSLNMCSLLKVFLVFSDCKQNTGKLFGEATIKDSELYFKQLQLHE